MCSLRILKLLALGSVTLLLMMLQVMWQPLLHGCSICFVLQKRQFIQRQPKAMRSLNRRWLLPNSTSLACRAICATVLGSWGSQPPRLMPTLPNHPPPPLCYHILRQWW